MSTLTLKLISIVVLSFLTNSCIFYILNLGVKLIRRSKTKRESKGEEKNEL